MELLESMKHYCSYGTLFRRLSNWVNHGLGFLNFCYQSEYIKNLAALVSSKNIQLNLRRTTQIMCLRETIKFYLWVWEQVKLFFIESFFYSYHLSAASQSMLKNISGEETLLQLWTKKSWSCLHLIYTTNIYNLRNICLLSSLCSSQLFSQEKKGASDFEISLHTEAKVLDVVFVLAFLVIGCEGVF